MKTLIYDFFPVYPILISILTLRDPEGDGV